MESPRCAVFSPERYQKEHEQQCTATDPLFIHRTRFITGAHFGGTTTKYIIRVPPRPNTSSYFKFCLFGFLENFHWCSIHRVEKYWLHFRPQSIAAEVGLFHKTFSVQYSFNVLYLKDQVKTEWIHCIAFVMGRAFGLDAFLAHEKEFTQNFRFPYRNLKGCLGMTF